MDGSATDSSCPSGPGFFSSNLNPDRTCRIRLPGAASLRIPVSLHSLQSGNLLSFKSPKSDCRPQDDSLGGFPFIPDDHCDQQWYQYGYLPLYLLPDYCGLTWLGFDCRLAGNSGGRCPFNRGWLSLWRTRLRIDSSATATTSISGLWLHHLALGRTQDRTEKAVAAPERHDDLF